MRKCLGFSKSWLIREIRKEGAATVLVDWNGTDGEAIETIVSDPREVYYPGGPCENSDPETGRCLGHREFDDDLSARELSFVLRKASIHGRINTREEAIAAIEKGLSVGAWKDGEFERATNVRRALVAGKETA